SEGDKYSFISGISELPGVTHAEPPRLEWFDLQRHRNGHVRAGRAGWPTWRGLVRERGEVNRNPAPDRKPLRSSKSAPGVPRPLAPTARTFRGEAQWFDGRNALYPEGRAFG